MAKRKINWQKKCDDTWRLIIKFSGSCFDPDCRNPGNNACHLLEKSVWTHLRYVPLNGIGGCASHHMFNKKVCAHAGHKEAENGTLISNPFDLLLQREFNTQYHWRERNKDNKKHRGETIDYESTYHYLLNILNDIKCGIELKDLDGGKYYIIINNETTEFNT